MTDIIAALGLHGVPELFMAANEDIDRYKGTKAVIAIMAPARSHPEFEKASQYFAQLEEGDELVIIAEDHADGPLHERFRCGAQEFRFALVDKAGNYLIQREHIPTLQEVRERLQSGPTTTQEKLSH